MSRNFSRDATLERALFIDKRDKASDFCATLAEDDDDAKLSDMDSTDSQLHANSNKLSASLKSSSNSKAPIHVEHRYCKQQCGLLKTRHGRRRRKVQQQQRSNCILAALCCVSCLCPKSALAAKLCKCKLVLPALVLAFVLAVYWLPFFAFEPRVPFAPLPDASAASALFDFTTRPLRATPSDTIASVERLFNGQLHGPEALAFDSQGNLYTAVEGGFVLYAHLNQSSTVRHTFLHSQLAAVSSAAATSSDQSNGNYNSSHKLLPVFLLKVADLNSQYAQLQPHSQTSGQQSARTPKAAAKDSKQAKSCLLDEQLYGQLQSPPALNSSFSSNVVVSRCSKPLGVRLSADESYLYVVDAARGLFKVHLRVPERPHANLRLVQRLVDFKPGSPMQLPIYDYNNKQSASNLLNVTLLAVDDLAVEHNASSRNGDVIYLTLASERYKPTSVIYQLLEGIPSGGILRYDVSANELSILDPQKLAHVRHSPLHSSAPDDRSWTGAGIGAPRLDEEDAFDDRPLNFPNGVELTPSKDALLITESLNKRIVKHFIRGPRAGDTDLWAWTPMIPDNIRRTSTRDGRNAYWTIGCGEDLSTKLTSFDLAEALMGWPRVRKFAAKLNYALGATIESLGALFRSLSLTNFGYKLKTSEALLDSFCPRFIAIKYNSTGEILQSVHAGSFDADFRCFSHVTEVETADEHFLYLGNPLYSFLARLKLNDSNTSHEQMSD